MKVVINACYGGFGLSPKAIARLAELKGRPAHSLYDFVTDRADPDLVRTVEELGEEADGQYAKLRVVEIPDGVSYEIGEYDGFEHIAETHRTWS